MTVRLELADRAEMLAVTAALATAAEVQRRAAASLAAELTTGDGDYRAAAVRLVRALAAAERLEQIAALIPASIVAGVQPADPTDPPPPEVPVPDPTDPAADDVFFEAGS